MKNYDNLIMKICEANKAYNDCKWYNFIKKHKLNIDLEDMHHELNSLSTYTLSDLMFNFIYPLISSNKIILADISDKFTVDSAGMQFLYDVPYNNSTTKIDYYISRKCFIVNTLDHTYTLLPVMYKPPTKFRREWRQLSSYIKELCIDSIYKTISKLNGE